MGTTHRNRRIVFFLQDLGSGGAERMVLLLSGRFAARGWQVTLAVSRRRGALAPMVPPGVRVVDLGVQRLVQSLPRLLRLLRRLQPDVLFSTLVQVNAVAVVAHRLFPGPLLVVREASDPRPVRRAADPNPLTRLAVRLLPWLYRRADLVLGVSQGVAEAMIARGVPRERIATPPNPSVDARFARDPARPAHPWFAPGQPPVVICLGRLGPEKNQSDLLAACARKDRPAFRVLLIGEGADRAMLERRIGELGLAGRAAILPHQPDPHPFLAHAAALVLPSLWEGCPNAVIEALACGTPVVAYDCDFGPRELLEGGRLGKLVQVGDIDGLAGAIATAITGGDGGAAARSARRERVARHRLEPAALMHEAAILRALGSARRGARP